MALTLLLASTQAAADVRSAGIRRAAHGLGDARSQDVNAAVTAALELESPPDIPGLDAPLILAIAWAESRFDVTAKPLCGVMQVWPRDMEVPRSMCKAWRRDVRAGVVIGIAEIRKILVEIPRVRRDLRRALEYRACGGKAFTRHCHKRRWIARVTAIADHIRKPQFRMEHSDVHGHDRGHPRLREAPRPKPQLREPTPLRRRRPLS